MKLAGCKSALNPLVVYSTDRSKAVVPVLFLLFVALWVVLRGGLFYVLPCVILLLCFSVLLALWLPRLGKRELTLVLFVRLFDLCLFGFVSFLFLLVSGKGCGLWLWHSLDFSLTFVLRFSDCNELSLCRHYKHETAKEFCSLYNKLEKHFRSLEALQQDTSQDLFISIITVKLPKGVCYLWR